MKYLILAALPFVMILVSCKQNKGQKNPNLESDLNKLDERKGEFKPGYFKDASKAHIAVQLSFKNNQFVLAPGAATLRPGRSPYTIGDTSKAFVVKYKTAAGNTIGSYSFNNPALLRACEGKNPEISILDSVTFEILLPAGKEIANVELFDRGKAITSFAVPPVRNQLGDTTKIMPGNNDTLK